MLQKRPYVCPQDPLCAIQLTSQIREAFSVAALFYFSVPRGKVYNVTCSWLQACVSSRSSRKESRAFSAEPWSICVSHTPAGSLPTWVAVQWKQGKDPNSCCLCSWSLQGRKKNGMLGSILFSQDQVRKANLGFRPLTLFYPLCFAWEFL